MWRRRKDNLKRRMMSGILACLLVATSLTNTVGIITAFAGETANTPRVSYSYDSLRDSRGNLEKMVQINVQAENESFAPGSEMVLKVYVQNLSDETLTGGSLKWTGKGLENAGFLDEEEEDLFNGPGWTGEDGSGDSGLMEEIGSFSITSLRKSVPLRIDSAEEESEAPEGYLEDAADIESEEEEDSAGPETDGEGKRIRGIELAPGEVYETRFYGTVEEAAAIATKKVSFEFLAGTDDGKVAQDKAEFTYNTGMALVLPIEFDDGPALMTNELNTMYIHTRFEDEGILDEYTWNFTDEEEATPSNAERHEITVATLSNGTEEDSKEGTSPVNMKYSIVTYGAKLEGINAWYDSDRSGWGETVTGVSFRVKDNTEPGVYFGQVTTSIRRNGKSYKTTQGFHFFVLGDGQLVLKGSINGAEIQVKGDRTSFPAGDMLSLKVTEVPAEKMDLVQEAMAQKAEELGVSVDKMKAMDIKVIADGVEQELEGEVEVTFSNLKLEKVEENIITAGEEEEIEEEEAEEFEEISNFSVLGLRKAGALEEDQAEEAAEEETEAGEETEESTLAVWHLDEEAGAIDEMDSEVTDDGDVVMVTEHFSIYIVVNVPNVKEVPVTIEHWAEVDKWVFGDKGLPLETVVGKRLYPGTPSGSTVYNKELKKIYLDDITTIPNGAGTGISYEVAVSNWSKVALGGNYKVKEVTITNSKYPDGKTVSESNSGIDKLELAATNNVIKIIYEPTTDSEIKGYADFHDYNVAIDNDQSSINADKVGINNSSLTGGEDTDEKRIYIGIGGSKDPSVYGHTAVGPNKIGIVPNIPKNELENNQIKFEYQDPGLFVTADVLTKESWKGSTIKTDYYAKKYLPNYQLGFVRKGDNYTLKTVYDENGINVLTELDSIRLSYQHDGTGKKLYSNLFWPLDSASYGEPGKNRDYLYGSTKNEYGLGVNDEVYGKVSNEDKLPDLNFPDKGHNWFFGMRFDVEFSIGDYDGDMNYYFRGDDDLWLFIDGKRVTDVDLGGIHSSMGAYVDFKQWMETDGKDLFYKKDSSGKLVLDRTKKHTMTVFFMERGATGSCCYMSFTLPNATPIPSPSAETISKTVTKNWVDGNNDARQRPQFILVQLQQNGVDYGNPVTLDSSNDWKYTWNNLPKYKDIGKNTEHDYTVKEISTPPEYSTSTNGFTITNTLVGEIKVKKEWINEDTAAQSRPGSVQVQLYKSTDGGKTKVKDGDPITLNDSNGWKYTWTEKPLYTTEDKIIYSVEEIGGNWLFSETNQTGWYEGTVTGDQEAGFTVTNTYIPSYTSKEVKKVWVDDNNKFGLRPEKIEIVLYQNGQNYGEAVTLPITVNGEQVWVYKWDSLPNYYYTKNSNGTVTQTAYEYTVKEVITDSNGNYYNIAYAPEDTKDETVTITNTLKTAKFRVAKSIDNYNAKTEEIVLKDLQDDEFIIKVEEQAFPSDKAFSTGLVLKHAGVYETDIIKSSEVSGYIELPVTDKGTLYKITEIVPKEYTPSETFLSTIALSKEGVVNAETKDMFVKEEPIGEYSGVRIFPNADVIVVVHNNFDHKDYFHNDVSVTNLFLAGQRPGVESDTINLVVSMNAFLPEEIGKDWERKHQDEERLM